MDSVRNDLHELRKRMMKEWNRVVPSNEHFFDRWEKARFIGAGEGSSIYDSCLILGDVKIGSNTWIGPYTVLDGSGGGLTIGEYCSISAGVQIYTHDTVMWSLSGGIMEKVAQKTEIGNNCYIGPLCIISMGVSIGNRCVVGANSFVNRSFPDHSIIAGTPARRIGTVQLEESGSIVLNYDHAKSEEQ
jgi:acetyltransferase-like isoleucine patch superfamily enzyme